MTRPPPHPPWLAWVLGFIGVTVFALTLPMTRIATGTADHPQLSPWFVTWARCVLAGGLSALYLWLTRSPLPQRAHLKPLGLTVLGNAVGYPLLLGWALREVTAGHAAVITALMPLATAALAAWLLHQRARLGFWLFAVLGALLVMGFSLWRIYSSGQGWHDGHWTADLLLVGAVLASAMGYATGASVTAALGAERVISWVCVMALPLCLPLAWWTWPQQAIDTASWWALAYTGVFSMWMGFFAWYRGLAMGGALHISQVQLLQPFISIVAAMPLLGEAFDPVTLGFASAVVVTVFLGRRYARPAPSSGPQAMASSSS